MLYGNFTIFFVHIPAKNLPFDATILSYLIARYKSNNNNNDFQCAICIYRIRTTVLYNS